MEQTIEVTMHRNIKWKTRTTIKSQLGGNALSDNINEIVILKLLEVKYGIYPGALLSTKDSLACCDNINIEASKRNIAIIPENNILLFLGVEIDCIYGTPALKLLSNKLIYFHKRETLNWFINHDFKKCFSLAMKSKNDYKNS